MDDSTQKSQDISRSRGDHNHSSQSSTDSPLSPTSPNMATSGAHTHPLPLSPAANAGVGKRYRPAPAKTFQCRGYGDCRMVFSRSEHLARHIRKHTGERPFSCHCGKQFSRLDNLRQHAQTVHADKQDQNERMMRDLTSLHAAMAAASKQTSSRGKRSNASVNAHTHGGSPTNIGLNLVKQEDATPVPMHQRPGTSSGYEGDHADFLYGGSWHVQTQETDRPDSRPSNNHSFRDPSQSFLAPRSNSSGHSFLPLSSAFQFGLPNPARDRERDIRPGSSSSRPPTSGAFDANSRTLPPLSTIVPASLTSSSSQQSIAQQYPPSSHILPFPGSLAFRRPSTASRPGTAPASFFSTRFLISGPGLAARPDATFLPSGRSGHELGPGFYGSPYDNDDDVNAGNDSPFSFHPPAVPEPATTASGSAAAVTSSPLVGQSRKRPFPGAEGPDDRSPDDDYGSASRPQSRRLSVMELCNDPNTDPGIRPLLPVSTSYTGGGFSRPSTSSGLVSSASALALVDRSPGPSPALFARAAPPATIPASPTSRGGAQEFGTRGISPTARRGIPASATSPSFAAAYASASAAGFSGGSPSILSFRGQLSPALSDDSSSRSPSSPSSFFAVSPGSVGGVHSQPPSPATAPGGDALSRRAGGQGGDGQHDQVRIAVASSHASSPHGLRV